MAVRRSFAYRCLKYGLMALGAVLMAWRAAAQVSTQSLIENFAPIVVNQLSDNTQLKEYDHVDAIFYDVEETATHAYLSYHVMKGWSIHPDFQRFVSTEHPVDSEDVHVVVHKTGAALSDYKVVLFATNSHGAYLVYPHSAEITTSEMDNFAFKTSFLEKFSAFTPRALHEMLKGSTEMDSYLGPHPIVASAAGSHALSRSTLQNLIGRNVEVAAPESVTVYNAQTYTLKSLKNEIDAMVKATMLKGEDHKAQNQSYCHGPNISYRGRTTAVPALPRVFEVDWFLKQYHPQLAQALQQSKKLAGYTERAHATIAYANGPWVGTADTNCPRLDPARLFARMYPQSFAAHHGSFDYLEHSWLDNWLGKPGFGTLGATDNQP